MQMLLCYDNEGVYVNTSGKVSHHQISFLNCYLGSFFFMSLVSSLKLVVCLGYLSDKQMLKNVVLQWGEMPTSVAFIGIGEIMGWGNKAIEIRNVETGHLDGVFMHKKAQRLKFLCERNDKVLRSLASHLLSSVFLFCFVFFQFLVCSFSLGVFLVSQRWFDLANLLYGSQQARNGKLVKRRKKVQREQNR